MVEFLDVRLPCENIGDYVQSSCFGFQWLW